MTPLVALVFRLKTGCRQYAFASVGELAAWSARHPYRNEHVRVMPVKDGKPIGDRWMPASEAASCVKAARGG